MPVRLVRCIAAAALGALIGTAAVPQTVELTPDELRQAAVASLRGGDAATARRYAAGLIARDPSDLNAQLIFARAARDMGDTVPARGAARSAWRLSETDEERYAAALITAQILSTEGKRTRAQLWIRRAVQNAPNDMLRARAGQDFSYVKQRNPWKTDLSLTLAPNSNINNGSARDSSRLNYAISELLFGEPIEFDLGTEAQAIAGVEFGGSVRTRYRFYQTPTTAHDAKLGLSYRSFVITDDLGDVDVSGSDFAYGTVSLGYGFRTFNMDKKGELALDAEAGQSWYGGARYASYARLQAQQTLATDVRQQLRFGAELERQWGQATPDRDTVGLSASITHGFASGNSGFAGLYLSAAQSDDATVEYGEVLVRTGLALAKPVMGAALQVGLGISFRDYEFSRDDPTGRQDKRIFADVTATFKDIDYYGFNPTLTLSASATDSNVGLYDVNRLGLSIGIKSAF
ncbi:DUF560 domain containing protein [Sulfitobacter noctilucae]|uniref:surface lipoprotein assembly modifier n=1 Tax=Sulfitobacter noctilucae TaxID=1342302 RepID=UPI00046AF3EB|nr:surface lipoprotein assembly modifier [Sulfitobacter noctilucae]KIN61661.1 DUF560 domain containing protein [Sulfitobacter noctilucae]